VVSADAVVDPFVHFKLDLNSPQRRHHEEATVKQLDVKQFEVTAHFVVQLQRTVEELLSRSTGELGPDLENGAAVGEDCEVDENQEDAHQLEGLLREGHLRHEGTHSLWRDGILKQEEVVDLKPHPEQAVVDLSGVVSEHLASDFLQEPEDGVIPVAGQEIVQVVLEDVGTNPPRDEVLPAFRLVLEGPFQERENLLVSGVLGDGRPDLFIAVKATILDIPQF
jgi:hypothetical protein